MNMLCSGVSRNRIAEQPKIAAVQFDELETFEHTKCKPLAVALAVEEKTRLIMGVEVSEMPAKGHLAQISREKYDPRKDLRRPGMVALFEKINFQVSYDQVKGERGSIGGQGELKKLVYDPLFWLTTLTTTTGICCNSPRTAHY